MAVAIAVTAGGGLGAVVDGGVVPDEEDMIVEAWL